MFYKNNKASSPKDIWIRIRFLEINGSQSLLITIQIYHIKTEVNNFDMRN